MQKHPGDKFNYIPSTPTECWVAESECQKALSRRKMNKAKEKCNSQCAQTNPLKTTCNLSHHIHQLHVKVLETQSLKICER